MNAAYMPHSWWRYSFDREKHAPQDDLFPPQVSENENANRPSTISAPYSQANRKSLDFL